MSLTVIPVVGSISGGGGGLTALADGGTKTSNFVAAPNTYYHVDTTSGVVTATFAGFGIGDMVSFIPASDFSDNALLLDTGVGGTINSLPAHPFELTSSDSAYALTSVSSTAWDGDFSYPKGIRGEDGGGSGSGTVTTVSVTTAAGVSGVVTNPTTTPAIAITLGAITPSSVAASGAVTGSNLSGTNTGDQTNISGNAATVTTNANLTGHVTSTGNAAVLGSFTLAQLSTAVSDADIARIDAAQTFVGAQIFTGAVTFGAAASSAGEIRLYSYGGGDLVTILGGVRASAAEWVFPDGGNEVFVGRTATQTLTNKTIDGSQNTLTVRLASDVTGTLPHGNLGTDGGGSTKFLREDSTWQAIPGGGDALTASSLDQFADVTQTGGATLAITSSTTLSGGTHSGTNTGDQTITLTGDVTGSGTGSFVTSIANDSITLAKVAHMATASLLGRNTAGTGTVEVLSASTARSTLGLGTLATQSGTFSGTSSGTNTGDQTNISGNAATVTTNANLTGHVTSVGNAAVLGSFTLAQLSTAVSDANIARTDAAQTFAGDQTFTGHIAVQGAGISVGVPSTSDATIAIFNENNGFYVAISGGNTTTGDQTWLLPDTYGNQAVFIARDLAQTITNKTISGANNTLTVRLANDVTGTLPHGNLGTGGGGSTKLLREDGTWQATKRTVQAQFGDLSTVIAVGTRAWVRVPVAGTITKVTMTAEPSGSAVVDIWKDTYANFPPTIADTITAAAKPTISAAVKSENSTLTGWTTSVAAGDILMFNVDSCSTITRLNLSIDLDT